jgi:hypothetical protein
MVAKGTEFNATSPKLGKALALEPPREEFVAQLAQGAPI